MSFTDLSRITASLLSHTIHWFLSLLQICLLHPRQLDSPKHNHYWKPGYWLWELTRTKIHTDQGFGGGALGDGDAASSIGGWRSCNCKIYTELRIIQYNQLIAEYLTHIDWNPTIRFGNFTSIYEEYTNSTQKIAGITQYSKPLARVNVTKTNKLSCIWDLIMSWYLHAFCCSYDKGHAQQQTSTN